MRLREGWGRCARGLFASLALVAWPGSIADGPLPRGTIAAGPDRDAAALVLGCPDLVGEALRAGLTPSLPEVAAGPPDPTLEGELDLGLVAAERTLVLAPEPAPAWLCLLSLAGAWGASRGRRRFPRSHPSR
jgi:hypothetical protein